VTPRRVAGFRVVRSYARTRALGDPARPGIRGIPRNQPPGVTTTNPPATVCPGTVQTPSPTPIDPC
jgi:hypothetical protein